MRSFTLKMNLLQIVRIYYGYWLKQQRLLKRLKVNLPRSECKRKIQTPQLIWSVFYCSSMIKIPKRTRVCQLHIRYIVPTNLSSLFVHCVMLLACTVYAPLQQELECVNCISDILCLQIFRLYSCTASCYWPVQCTLLYNKN
jgi:hypothetical protein